MIRAALIVLIACVVLSGCDDYSQRHRRVLPDPILDEDRYLDYELPDADASWGHDTRYHVSFDPSGSIVMIDHTAQPRHMLFYDIDAKTWSTTSPFDSNWSDVPDEANWARIKWARLGLPRLHGAADVRMNMEHPDYNLWLVTRCPDLHERKPCNETLWRHKRTYHIYEWERPNGLIPRHTHIPVEIGFNHRRRIFGRVDDGMLILSHPYQRQSIGELIYLPERHESSR